jgi:hypothetical protein
LAYPLLIKEKDLETLSFLLEKQYCIFSPSDLKSFLLYALGEKWISGLKVFLASQAAHTAFQNLQPEEQLSLIQTFVQAMVKTEDPRQRKTYAISLVEEVLTKKPYGKYVSLIALNGELSAVDFDLAKLAKECLKALTSEDLKQLHHLDAR